MVGVVVWVNVECWIKKHWTVWKFLRHIPRPKKKDAPPNSNILIYIICKHFINNTQANSTESGTPIKASTCTCQKERRVFEPLSFKRYILRLNSAPGKRRLPIKETPLQVLHAFFHAWKIHTLLVSGQSTLLVRTIEMAPSVVAAFFGAWKLSKTCRPVAVCRCILLWDDATIMCEPKQKVRFWNFSLMKSVSNFWPNPLVWGQIYV